MRLLLLIILASSSPLFAAEPISKKIKIAAQAILMQRMYAVNLDSEVFKKYNFFNDFAGAELEPDELPDKIRLFFKTVLTEHNGIAIETAADRAEFERELSHYTPRLLEILLQQEQNDE